MLFLRKPSDLLGEIERLWHCCDGLGSPNWVALPIEGCTLRSCLLASCGKRGTLFVVTEELPPLHLVLDHHVLWGALCGIEQRFLALDDMSVAIVIHPQANTRVRLAEAKVHFWPEDEDPTEYLAVTQTRERWTYGTAFDAKMGFEVIR